MGNDRETEPLDLKRLGIITLIGIILLFAAVFAAYRYSQKRSGNIILPGGVTYLGPTPAGATGEQPPTAPTRFTVADDATWENYEGKYYPFSFSYPSNLPIVTFIGDNNDTLAISWGNIPPQQNIILNIENIEKREPAYVKKPKIEYVKHWYTYFSGLKGVGTIDKFTNTNGMVGYKAHYINFAGVSPNLDVFFEVPGNSKLMVRMANGILEPKVFDRILDTFKWTTFKPTAIPTK